LTHSSLYFIVRDSIRSITSIFAAEFRVIIISSRPWDFLLGHQVLHGAAEDSASAVLVLRVRVSPEFVQILAERVILSWPWGIVRSLIQFGIFDLVARAVSDLGEDVSAAGVERLD
jgi:hypothetical protein